MNPLSDFLPYVLPYARDCPEPVAYQAIRDACIRFCEKTDYVLTEVAGVVLTTSPTVTIVSGTDESVVRIQEAFVDDARLMSVTEEQLELIYGSTDWRIETGTPQYYLHLAGQDVVRLVPYYDVAPATNSILTMVTSTKPMRSASQVSTVLYERWADAIGMGALSRLMEMPGQPFSDPAGAVRNSIRFSVEMQKAAIERNRASGRVNMRFRPPGVF